MSLIVPRFLRKFGYYYWESPWMPYKTMFWSKFATKFSVSCLVAIAATWPINVVQAESVFDPYKDAIREQIPVGLSLRLPDRIVLKDVQEGLIENFTVRVFVTQSPSRMTVSLNSCPTEGCFIGSFVTDNGNNPEALKSLSEHQAMGAPITLNGDVRGFVRDSPQPHTASSFATLMWEQDNMIHTLSFPQSERQNMMFMAVSMARSSIMFRP